jgi:hypothetical protein
MGGIGMNGRGRDTMPRWLDRMAATFLDADAADWRARIGLEVGRLGGVPFKAVHGWHADVLAPLALETVERRGGTPSAHLLVRDLHRRAQDGGPVSRHEWVEALCPALQEIYQHAFAHARAHARAHASAMAYARAGTNARMIVESFGSAEAYAGYYADLAAGSSAAAFADANARANAGFLAAAFAAADHEAYGEAYPHAVARAHVHAHARGGGDFEAGCRDAWRRLAEGMLDCLGRIR